MASKPVISAELLFETAEHLLVTKRLIFRRERVNVREAPAT